MKDFLTVKEFAEMANKKPQTIYKQLDKRLKPYVKIDKGQKVISAEALKDFYGVEQPFQPDSTVNQPKTTVKDENSTENQSNSTFDSQPKSTEKQQQTSLEKRIDELEKLLQKQIEEDRQEKEFLKEQIRQKDKTIENLTENLKMAQQLAAADKKKLLEIEQRQQDKETVEADKAAEVITPAPAANQEQGQADNQQEKEQPQERGLKAFLRRLKAFLRRLFG